MAHENIHVVGDEERLPKWAQRELESQRKTIQTLHDKLRSFENAPEDSPVFLRDYVSGDVSLPAGGHYVFQVDGPHDATANLEVTLEDDGTISVNGSDGRIAILPTAANRIRLRLESLFS